MNNLSRKLLVLLLAVCLCVCLLPSAAAAADDDAPPVSTINVSFLFGNLEGNGRDIRYDTALTICPEMIDIVVFNKDNTPMLGLLRFTCTLSDALTEKLTEPIPDYQFSNLKFNGDDFFELEGSPRLVRGRIQFTFKLKNSAGLSNADADALRTALGQTITFRAAVDNAPVSDFDGASTLNTVATIDIKSDDDFDVPGYHAISVRAAYGSANTDLTAAPTLDTHSVTTGVEELLNTTDDNAFLQGYPDGTFRPQNTITRAEAAVALYRQLLPNTKATKGTVTFSDVDPNCWYGEAVSELAELGIIKGVGGGKFAPNRPITRADFAVILSRFAKPAELDDSDIPFFDVPVTHYAYSSVMTAVHYGWVNGIGGGKFAPAKNITRAEAAKMLCLFMGRTYDKFAVDCGYARSFPDVTDAHWAYYYIAEVTTPHNCIILGGSKCWDLSK